MPRSPPARQSEEAAKPEKIPRPPNAWIIYRTDRLREWKAARSPNDPPVKQADISRMIGSKWKREGDHVKLEYEKRAAIAKAEHKKKYPNYKYNPMSREAKEKMRAEEREAKKKAREEAKAAKVAERKVSNSSRVQSITCTPSSSNVKLEVFDQAVKPVLIPEPLHRGCGPSPPIDYDPESSSTASSTPLLSSCSSGSIRSSPFPLSSVKPPSASLGISHTPWLQGLSSPVSSPLAQPPPPAYPSGYVHSPAPSRQSSYNFNPMFPPSSDTSSTPSDSPPSYSEGDGWQSQPPGSAYQTFTALPEVQGDWSTYTQYQPLAQPDLTFPQPVIDPLLCLPDPDVVNFTSTSAEAVFDISTAPINSTRSPPREIDSDYLQQLLRSLEQQPMNSADQLGPILDMPELHESIEDRADDAGIPAPAFMPTFSLEDFAGYVNAHPAGVMSMAYPGPFYHNLALQFAAACSQGFAGMQPTPFAVAPNAAPVTQALASEQNATAYQTFPFAMQGQVQQPQLAMPVPIVPVAMHALSSTPSPIHTDVVVPAPAFVHTPVSANPTEFAPAQAPGRYVPPSGAGMPARRRVGGRHDPRRLDGSNDSD